MISEKQLKIYNFISGFMDKNGYAPSVREICSAVGLSSTSTVQSHLNTLEKEGYITRSSGKTRAISLTDFGKSPEGVPILGTVAAGQPILAVEDAIGYIPYNAGDSGEFFALKIKGDSMIKAGIMNGDMVIVRRQQSARRGEIVIALIGDEATCKRYMPENGEVWLMPENDGYDPIDGTDAKILGRVTTVIRIY